MTCGQRGAWLDSTKGFTCKIVYVAASHYTLHARLPCFGFWLNNFVFLEGFDITAYRVEMGSGTAIPFEKSA